MPITRTRPHLHWSPRQIPLVIRRGAPPVHKLRHKSKHTKTKQKGRDQQAPSRKTPKTPADGGDESDLSDNSVVRLARAYPPLPDGQTQRLRAPIPRAVACRRRRHHDDDGGCQPTGSPDAPPDGCRDGCNERDKQWLTPLPPPPAVPWCSKTDDDCDLEPVAGAVPVGAVRVTTASRWHGWQGWHGWQSPPQGWQWHGRQSPPQADGCNLWLEQSQWEPYEFFGWTHGADPEMLATGYIKYKRTVAQLSKQRPLPYVFTEGGTRSTPPSVQASPEGCRAHSVMGLVSLHNMEFRRWRPVWSLGDGTVKEWDRWRYVAGVMPKLAHGQDRLKPMARDVFTGPEDEDSSWPTEHMDFRNALSTIVVPHRTEPGYWARDVAVVSFPQLLVWFQHQRTAAELLDEFKQSPVIVQRYRNKAARPDKRPGAGKGSAMGSQWRRPGKQKAAGAAGQPMTPPPWRQKRVVVLTAAASHPAGSPHDDDDRHKRPRWMHSRSPTSNSS